MGKKILVVIGAAVHNKGSEALLTGLTQICRKAGAKHIAVSSADLKCNDKLDVPLIDESIPRYKDIYHMPFIKRLLTAIRRRIDCSDLLTQISCGDFLKNAKGFDLTIIIGADNLDRRVKFKRELYSLTEMIKKDNVTKILLYDCSIDKNNIDSQLVKELNYFDAISARDMTSYQNIKSVYDKDNLHYFPDPAFTIDKEVTDLKLKTIDSNTVGLNVSNLIVGETGSAKYELIFNSCCKLIEYITQKTNMWVVLIPHVMNNADLLVLQKLYNKYKVTGKVILINNEKLNAKQLKYIISKCRFFVGARTHATIAAYSSCVPTLVLGYSIKSVGIARDLFGTEENFVLPVSKLKTEHDLVNGFKWLRVNEDKVRNHLIEVMPEYIEKAWEATDLIKELLGD